MRYAFIGHLWQARPFSCALDEDHFWAAIRYVERNPVRAHMVNRAEDYPWSSAAAHCGFRQDPLLDSEWISPTQIQNWAEWLSSSNARQTDRRLRDRTFTGRPCGNDSFIKEAERVLGRELATRNLGVCPPNSRSVSIGSEYSPRIPGSRRHSIEQPSSQMPYRSALGNPRGIFLPSLAIQPH